MDKNTNQKTLAGHFDNLQQMAVFCENKVDCRRYLQLIHLGEKFDRQVCISNPSTVCDNCENRHEYEEVDMTKHARNLVQLVNDISSSQNVTMLQVADIYSGSKKKKIVDMGQDKHPLYGGGSNLNKNDVHRILKELIFNNTLTDYCTFTGDFPIVYIKTGPNFGTMQASKGKQIMNRV